MYYSPFFASLTGYKISFFTIARICAPNTKTHMIANKTVIAEATHKMAGLSNCLPISAVAVVNPTFGKTNAHHVSVKDILA